MAPVASSSTKPIGTPSSSSSAASRRRAPEIGARGRGARGRAAPGPRSGRGLGLDTETGAPPKEAEPMRAREGRVREPSAIVRDERLRERAGARRMAWVVLTIKRLT